MIKPDPLAPIKKLYKQCGKELPRFKKETAKLIKKGRETGDFLLIGSVYYYLALASWRCGGERDVVLMYAIKATAMLEQTKEYLMIAKCNNMLGIAYDGQENYQMALECFNKAYAIARRNKNCTLDNRLITLNNIAECYYRMGDFKGSIKIFSRCLDEALRKIQDNHYSVVIYRLNLANCYQKDNDCLKAIEVLDPMEEWIDELTTPMWVCMYYARRACILFELGDVERGDMCVDKSLAFVGEGSDTYEVHKEFEEMAHSLIRIGEFERAGRIADILTDYANKSGHTIDRLIACRVTADLYSKKGELSASLKKYEELNELYDRRTVEIRAMQLTVHKKIEEAGREINKLNRTIKASTEIAMKEPLTGLLNRAALLKTASEFIETAQNKKEKVGAVFVDIDYFKQCNDTYGHPVGDEIIKIVAKACMAEETSFVRFARYGGDEFFGITRGLKNEKVIDIAKRICQRIREANIPNENSPGEKRVTLSVGVVNENITERTNTIIDIVNFADKALYHAKDSGRNSIFMLNYDNIDADGSRSIFLKVDTP